MRDALAGAVLLVCLAGCYVWFAIIGSTPDSLPVLPPSSELAVAEEGGDGDGQPTLALGARALLPSPSGDHEDVATPTAVRVVDQLSGEAVEEADVWFVRQAPVWQDLPRAQLTEVQRRLTTDRERYCQEFGEHVVSGSDGLVSLRLTRTHTEVVARKGNRFGQVVLDSRDPPAGGFVVELDADREIVVRVVGAMGQPVPGMRVRASYVTLDTWKQKLAPRVTTAGFSDANGWLHIRHVQSWPVREFNGRRRVRLEPEVLGRRDKQFVGLDFDRLPLEPVELRCPPMGSVVVRTVDSEGRTLAGISPALWTMADDGERLDLAFWPETQADGATSYPFVALDHDLGASARFGDVKLHTTGPGPRTEGARSELVLRSDGSTIILRGRAVDHRGTALGRRSVKARFESPDRDGWNLATTDNEGCFWFHVPKRMATAKRVEFQVGARPGGGDGGSETMSVAIALSGALRAGTYDVGDLVMTVAPLVVAGQLVNISEDEFARATLRVDRRRDERWVPAVGLDLKRGSGGHFEVRGKLGPGRLRLCVSGQQFLEKHIEFVPGERDLRIEMERGGSIGVTVLHDEGVSREWLRLLLTPVGPRPDNSLRRIRDRQVASQEGELRWRWSGLQAGTYRLEARVKGEAQPVATVDGIAVASGERTEDDRLTIDLRGRLLAIQIEVRDSAGAPVNARGAAAVVLLPGDPAELVGFRIALGRTTIPSSGSSVDLAIVVPGHRVECVYGVTDGARVTMRPGPRVRLRFHCDRPLPAGYRWEAELWAHREDPDVKIDWSWGSGSLRRLIFQGQRVFAVGTDVRMTLQAASKYRVAVFLGNLGDHTSRPVVDPEPQFIDVADSDTEQFFDVRIPVASLERAFRRKVR